MPVVVMPDTLSNIASVSPTPGAPSMKGSAPNSGSATQTPAVSMKLCCRLSPCPRGAPLAQASATSRPESTVISADCAKASQCGSSDM
ncbi:hypothetical protein FAZ78_03595 [Cereibacter changlensis]|uniref:Uncharacterized protein n=1 Tax=Cereibacter changlensis TaxID=402884 RepID=A0A4U0Z5T5_9RHOB|nr:hypothetical protein [Cereibacter changlensis]TKA97921.1 hypothetical protein FAZ78_03595 [Cereibacter changlensis]